MQLKNTFVWNSVNICILVITFEKSHKWILFILKIYKPQSESQVCYFWNAWVPRFQNFCQELKLRGNYVLRNVNLNSGKASEIKLSVSNDIILTFVFGFPHALKKC